jgi:hypothetical protein
MHANDGQQQRLIGFDGLRRPRYYLSMRAKETTANSQQKLDYSHAADRTFFAEIKTKRGGKSYHPRRLLQ